MHSDRRVVAIRHTRNGTRARRHTHPSRDPQFLLTVAEGRPCRSQHHCETVTTPQEHHEEPINPAAPHSRRPDRPYHSPRPTRAMPHFEKRRSAANAVGVVLRPYRTSGQTLCAQKTLLPKGFLGQPPPNEGATSNTGLQGRCMAPVSPAEVDVGQSLAFARTLKKRRMRPLSSTSARTTNREALRLAEAGPRTTNAGAPLKDRRSMR